MCIPSNSVWTVPVWGDDPGDACYQAPPATNLPCEQAWRWNLDRVVDPHGVEMQYQYRTEENRYRIAGGFLGEGWYDSGGSLWNIRYGAGQAVFFDVDERCSTFPAEGCPALIPRPASQGGNAEIFPDVPSDLVCRDANPCTAIRPTFFTTMRYTGAHTYTKVSTEKVDDLAFFHTFIDDGFGNKKLWLTGIQRTGVSNTPAITLPRSTT
jgi:hypothetical protein